jgi:DNA-binding ferritin-like protein
MFDDRMKLHRALDAVMDADKPKRRPLEELKDTVAALQVLQASVVVACTKVNGFRLNVEGENFYEYHEFFAKLVEKLEQARYAVGERIRMLHGVAEFSTVDIMKKSLVNDLRTPLTDPKEMVKVVAEDCGILSEQARDIFAMSGPVADAGTIKVMTWFCADLAEHFGWETRVMQVMPVAV